MGATAGIILSFMFAVAAAHSSATPLQTFVSTLLILLTIAVVVTGVLLAIDRQSSAQQTAVGPAPGVVLGGFWLRAVALIIDVIPFAMISLILVPTLGAAGQPIIGIIAIAYFIGLWGATGQTLGMMMVGLRIVREADGGKLLWGSAVLRFIGLLVAFACIYIGVIWVAFDARKRGWADLVGGTVVIRTVG